MPWPSRNRRQPATPDLTEQHRRDQTRDQERAHRQAMEDQWRTDRNQMIATLHAAEHAHRAALKRYHLYAPGTQKDRAAQTVNQTADHLCTAQADFAQINQFSAWKTTNGL